MTGDSAERALARIEAALARIEAAASRSGSEGDELLLRHERLRYAVGEALVQLDELLAGHPE